MATTTQFLNTPAATSIDEARAAERAGCDFVIAQGTEAGGHVRGRIGLLPLLGGVASGF